MDTARILQTQCERRTAVGTTGGWSGRIVALLLSLAAHAGLGWWLQQQFDWCIIVDSEPKVIQVRLLTSFATSIGPRPATAAASVQELFTPQPSPLREALTVSPPLPPLALAPTVAPAPPRPETRARSIPVLQPELPARKAKRARAQSASAMPRVQGKSRAAPDPAETRAPDRTAARKHAETGAPESVPSPAVVPAAGAARPPGGSPRAAGEDGTEAVTVVQSPVPHYPFSARRLGIEGTVRLRLRVSPQGLPDLIDVKKTSGSAVLDRAAESSLRRWRFRPAREAGVAVARWVEIAVCFKLTGQVSYALGTANVGECRD